MPTVAVPTGPQSEASDIGWSSLLFLPSTSAYPGEIWLKWTSRTARKRKDTQVGAAGRGGLLWWLCLHVHGPHLAASSLPPIAAARSSWAKAPPAWVPGALGATFQCSNRGPAATSNISGSLREVIHLPMTGLPRLNEMSCLCFWLEFCQLCLAALLILGWSGALIGPYRHPWQIKMNYYLINAIGLANMAFQSSSP